MGQKNMPTLEERKIIKEQRTKEMMAELEKTNKVEFFKHIPKKYQYLFLRVHFGKASSSDRIKLKCIDCSCWQQEEVTLCEVWQCGLWAIRPYQKK